MKKIIVFDLDGTLSIIGDRLKYIKTKPKDYDSFYDACEEDLPNTPIIELFDMFNREFHLYKPIIVTGRRENTRKKTIKWFNRYSRFFIRSPILFMRKEGDERPDIIVKPELVKDFIGDIYMVFEDRSSMVNKWRELGLICLQVAKGDF